MKILKILLFILSAIVLVVLALGLFGPKSYNISRTAVITGTPEQVWPYLASFPKGHAWTPFARMDNTMTADYSGPEGAVGHKLTWNGKRAGSGEQTIVAMEPYKSIDSELKFFKPMEATAATSYHLQDTAGNTKLTWTLSGENGFMGRVMGVFNMMDKQMGPMFESGMVSLDSLMKAMPKEATPSFQITTGNYGGGKYLGIRGISKISALQSFFSTNFSKVMEGVQKSGAEMAGAPSGVYYVWEPEKNSTDLAAAIPINKEVKAPAGLSYFTVPAAKSLTIDYMGGYSGMAGPHNAMDAYMKSNNLEQVAPVLEEYITDPMTEPDSMKWHTRIIYFIK